MCVGILAPAPTAHASDLDLDGVDDASDNCRERANNQLDVDGDGFGNPCDGDLDQNGLVGGTDFGKFFQRFGCDEDDPCWDAQAAAADLSGDGGVGGLDFGLMKQGLGRAPGPSGLGCAAPNANQCYLPPPNDPHLQALSVVPVVPHRYSDGYDQADIDRALQACGNGCNLLLLAQRYTDVAIDIGGSFPNGLSIYGFGPQTTVLESPTYGDLLSDPAWEPVIEIRYDANDGIVLQDFKVDGHSRSQPAPVLGTSDYLDRFKIQRFSGIYTFVGGMRERKNGRIRGLEVTGFTSAAINISDAPNWIVEDNWVHTNGCHQVDVPCGAELPPKFCPARGEFGNPWDCVADAAAGPGVTIAGLKVPSFGIIVLNDSSDTIVRRNLVERITKIGIEIYSDACNGGTFDTRRVQILDNEVHLSGTGIVTNGGCETLVQDNRVFDSFVSGGELTDVGKGYACGTIGSEGNRWIGNRAERTQASAYNLSCGSAGDLEFIDNVAVDPCMSNGSGSAGLWVSGDATQPSNLLIDNFRLSGAGGCLWGAHIERRDAVTIRNSQIEGGTLYGLELQGTNDLSIEDSALTAAAGGSAFGVHLNYQGATPLTDTFVQSSASITGFDAAAKFTTPFGPDDGDSVAVCALESSLPAGCDP